MMVKYLLCLLPYLVLSALAACLSPILPLFAKEAWGFTLNANSYDREPRLPRWLSWFQTWDNSLWGDERWRASGSDYKTYWGMVRWLLRNKLGGFFGFSSVVLWPELLWGSTGVEYRTPVYGSFLLVAEKQFQYRKCFAWGGLVWYMEFGWMLLPYFEQQASMPKPQYIFTLRVPKKVT